MNIHPTAIIHPTAELEEGVEIGPYVIVGPRVKIGASTVIGPHTVIEEGTVIGRKNKIGPFVTLGSPPQHLAYQGEDTRLEIGDENIIREYVSIHRGTTLEEGVTRIGHRCYLMAYVHVAHDCVLQDEVIMTNNASLAGHVKVGRGVVFGGFALVHQFCRVGDYAFVSAMSGFSKDVPPYVRVFGIPAKITGLNLVGLRRRGIERENLKALQRALKIYLSYGTLAEAIEKIREEVPLLPEVENFLSFLASPSKRGLMRQSGEEG